MSETTKYKMNVRQSRQLFNIIKLIDYKELMATINFEELGIEKEDVEKLQKGGLANVEIEKYVGLTGKIVGGLFDILITQSDEIFDRFEEFIGNITKKEVSDIQELVIEEYIDLVVKVFKDINFIGIIKKYGSSIISKLGQ